MTQRKQLNIKIDDETYDNYYSLRYDSKKRAKDYISKMLDDFITREMNEANEKNMLQSGNNVLQSGNNVLTNENIIKEEVKKEVENTEVENTEVENTEKGDLSFTINDEDIISHDELLYKNKIGKHRGIWRR